MGGGPGTPAKEVRRCATEMGVSDAPELPREPSCTGPALVDDPSPSALRLGDPPKCPGGLLSAVPRPQPSAGGRAPPSRPALRAPLLAAQRRLLPGLHCRRRRRRVRLGCAGSPRTQGYWVRGFLADPTAPRGSEPAAGCRAAPGAGNTQPERPRRATRAPGAVGPGERARPSGSESSLPSSGPRPLGWRVSWNLDWGWPAASRRVVARPEPRGRAPPAPSGPGPPPSSAAPRGSGAVPAQSPRRAAPRPTPASARLRVTWRSPTGPRGQEGGAEAGELTAAPRHWPGRCTRAVAGRQRYPELESFQLRRVELSGSGQGWAVGPGRAGPRGRRRKTEAARRQPDGALAVLTKSE